MKNVCSSSSGDSVKLTTRWLFQSRLPSSSLLAAAPMAVTARSRCSRRMALRFMRAD